MDQVGMVGAPALAANAAFRTGAGLVQILTTQEAQLPVSVLAVCATTRVMGREDVGRLAAVAREFNADVVAIGPGLSPDIGGEHVVALMRDFAGGIVIDADGLNVLSKAGKWRAAREGQVVVTPHPGEMRRLTDGLGMEGKARRHEGTKARRGVAEGVAKGTGAIVVLKGAGTVVTDGIHTYVTETGLAGLAPGGAGDVLTGIIAALMGQKMSACEAAVLAVYLHGRSGEIASEWVGQISVTALDMIDALGDAIDDHATIEEPG